MDVTIILAWLVENYPMAGTVLTIAGGLVVAGLTYVSLTPNTKDDTWVKKLEEKKVLGVPLGRILTAIRVFSPIQKKGKKKE